MNKTYSAIGKLLGGLILALAPPVALSVYGSLKWLKITKKQLFTKRLPTGHVGIKILQIADLHLRYESKHNLDIWKSIDSLDIDVVVITGDIINSSHAELLPFIEHIRALAKRIPVYFCSGNHEYYSMRNLVLAELRDLGVIVLDNDYSVFEKNGISYRISGFDDFYYSGVEKYYRVLERLNQDNQKEYVDIFMFHQPQTFEFVKRFEPVLCLCGHTHGGQVRIPLVPTIYAPGQGFFPKYGYGFYSYNNTKLFVSKGIGTTTFPVRLWNRPELVLMEIVG